MAVTDLVLIWLGTLAMLASAGMFMPSESMDRTTSILLPFIAATIWGVVAIAGFDVIVTNTDPPASVEMPSVAYLGLAFAMSSAVIGVYELLVGASKDVQDSVDESSLIDR